MGKLDTKQAASAMQAARLNSIDLLDSAEILFKQERFAHSVLFSILAIEESGKIIILQSILLESDGRKKLWQSYRLHRAKTEYLNLGIMGRIRATFPNIPIDEAQKIAANGPTPKDLETSKQRAIYSDCIDLSGEFICHLPRNVDWKQEAWERLCEARAIVLAPRDRTPEELDVWVKHVTASNNSKKTLAEILPDIHKELMKKGFVEEGWWEIGRASCRERV